jgi:adenylate cyclase
MALFLMSKKHKNLLAAIIFGILILVVVILTAWADLFGFWQYQLSDTFQKGRPVSPEIVIVSIDENTITENTGLGMIEKWNYDNFTRVLENINKYNPRVVAFDFFFKNERDAASAAIFRDALAKSGTPVIIYRMNKPVWSNQKNMFMQEKTSVTTPLPLALFRELKNVTTAASTVRMDDDSVIRRIMPILFDEQNGQYFENFPFAIARIFLQGTVPPSPPNITPDNYPLAIEGGKTETIPLEDGQMLINFASVPAVDSYKRISFLDVFDENYAGYVSPEEIFKDKIVLIGPSASSFQDKYATIYGKNKLMNGVEIHANAIQTILEQKFLRNFSPLEKYGLIALIVLLSVFVFMYTRIRWSLLYLVGVSAGYSILAPFAFSKGLIFDLIHPYLALALSFVAVYVYRYLTEFRQKTELKNAFSKYVNPGLVEQLSANPESLKLGGEKREITVLFTDIVHFTSTSEKLSPESTVALLNEYLDAMTRVIMDNGGTVDKFEGDAIMAFFGAPVAQPDHAFKACVTALQMRERIRELNKKWETDLPLPGGEKKPAIDFRCGISTGAAIVGNIGSKARFDYTAIGDIVNLGSRLEGANKDFETSIMASEACYMPVKERVVGRLIDVIRVVGKNEPIHVYEILAVKENLSKELEALLAQYAAGIDLYHARKFADALVIFNKVLEKYPDDGPSKKYRQRCEIYRDFPPAANWDGVYEMGSK